MTDETVLLANVSHETNTFAPGRTTRVEFRERHEYVGEEIPRRLRGTNTEVGGAVDAAESEGVDLRHTVAAAATPGGRVADDAFEHYAGLVLDGVEAAGEALDGVLLCLHGAMVTESFDDGEGELVARVREAVGDRPVVVTHDLHGNVSDDLIETADALVAFETYPHVDTGDTGRRGLRLLLRAIRGEVDPVTVVERPPVLSFGPLQNTGESPMADVMAAARDLEEREGVLKVNVFPGFNRADVPMMGFSVPVVGDGDPAAAREAARELAARVWGSRSAFVGDFPGPAAAVEEALAAVEEGVTAEGPVVLADVGDNPGGGGAADTTPLLRELIEQGARNAGFAIVRDPEAVAACVDAGVGERVSLDLGGKTLPEHSDPIEDLDGYVKALTDGEFRNTGPMMTGSENHLGRAVHLRCGADDGVGVLVVENRMQPLDAEIFRHAGVQPERLDVLAVKSTNHYRADYEPMASRVIPVDTPGLASMNPARFEHERIRRPQFPLDEMPDDAYPDWDR